MAKNQMKLLEDAYNAYTAQLAKNKTSAQNAIASSTEKAKSLLDNRLKMQGLNNSGVGLSRYTSLANQGASNIAQSNQNYNNQYASATQDYYNNLASYQQKYNDQIKSESEQLLNNMSDSQGDEYLKNLTGDYITDDTRDYLNNYLTALKTNRSNEALNSSKREIETMVSNGLANYDTIQKYINNANNLNQEQLTALQDYANILGYGWENTKNSYADELAEMINTVGQNEDLLKAYQNISGAKTKEDFDNALKTYDVDNLINSFINETYESKKTLNEWSSIKEMNNGDTISTKTLENLVSMGQMQKSGSNYTIQIEGTTYTFNKDGKLISGGDGEIAIDIKVNQTLSKDQLKELEQYYTGSDSDMGIIIENYYKVGNKEITVNKATKKVTEIKEDKNVLTKKPSGMPESAWQEYLKSIQK